MLNGAGQVAFIASLGGIGVNSSNDAGIFTNVGGTTTIVARKGDVGPGPNLGPGVTFSLFNTPRIERGRTGGVFQLPHGPGPAG